MTDARARLKSLEQRIDLEAREYKRRRLAEEMAKLAGADASAVFPPGRGDVPADPHAAADGADDGGPHRA